MSCAVHYAGRLSDGTRLDQDTAVEREPVAFHLGRGTMLKGWDVAVATMTRGEAALITLHPDWAHGDAGSPPSVPPRAWLQFELHLLDWQEVSIRDMDRSERMTRAQALKERGNVHFKANDLILALSHYEEALPFVEQLQGLAEGELHCTLLVNQAACLAKGGRHAEVWWVPDNVPCAACACASIHIARVVLCVLSAGHHRLYPRVAHR